MYHDDPTNQAAIERAAQLLLVLVFWCSGVLVRIVRVMCAVPSQLSDE
jgi:hypothetical protein